MTKESTRLIFEEFEQFEQFIVTLTLNLDANKVKAWNEIDLNED